MRIEAWRLKGSALVVLNRRAEAVAAFEEIFALAPAYELPGETSPRVLAVFLPARTQWQVQQEARLASELGSKLSALGADVQLPSRGKGGAPSTVLVRLADEHRLVDRIILAYRRRGARSYSTMASLATSGDNKLVIPGSVTASDVPFVMDLYVQILHRSGLSLRRIGAADSPLAIAYDAGQVSSEGSVLRKWWFWTGAAVVLSAAAIIGLRATEDMGPQRIVIRGGP
jgi:hypothetical protein